MAKKQTAAESASALQKINHRKDYAESVQMVKNYQKARTKLNAAKKKEAPVPVDAPDWPISFSFNKKGIQYLLKKPGCAGLRMYPAIHPDGNMTLVLVAFDENGENLSPGVDSIPAKASVKSRTAAKTTMVAMDNPTQPQDEDTLDESQVNPPFSSPTLP